jgi:RNA polymerase sigma-70 factor (ECF subfamily)
MRLFKKNYEKYSDEELMLLFIKGDRKSFEQIYIRYGNYLVNYFNRKLWQDRNKAEDFTQEIFGKIIDRPEMFDTSKKFKTWLFTVASNMCKNEYKRVEIRKSTRNDLPEGYEGVAKDELADNVLDKKTFAQNLNLELNKLKDKHKEVFMLRHFEGLSLKEIAVVLDINEGTVKSRLHNVTKTLASKLEVYRKIIAE